MRVLPVFFKSIVILVFAVSLQFPVACTSDSSDREQEVDTETEDGTDSVSDSDSGTEMEQSTETGTDQNDDTEQDVTDTGTRDDSDTGSTEDTAQDTDTGEGGDDTEVYTGPGDQWRLVWNDEFDGPGIDFGKWNRTNEEYECWGGGNNELQCYVDSAQNSFIEDGMLHIRALRGNPTGASDYTSAKLDTRHKGDWKYGRMEARIKLPSGKGLWPAFWMMPTDSVYGGWAASGEIDIMEAVNTSESDNRIWGTLHYGGTWPDNDSSGTSYSPPVYVAENFFVYALEWEEGKMRWYVNDELYATQTSWYTDDREPFPAPFDQRFYIILNVAVGGDWPGSPDGTTVFPTEMVVDYVRVYECKSDPVSGKGCDS